MIGNFAFGGNNSGGTQFRSLMPGVPVTGSKPSLFNQQGSLNQSPIPSGAAGRGHISMMESRGLTQDTSKFANDKSYFVDGQGNRYDWDGNLVTPGNNLNQQVQGPVAGVMSPANQASLQQSMSGQPEMPMPGQYKNPFGTISGTQDPNGPPGAGMDWSNWNGPVPASPNINARGSMDQNMQPVQPTPLNRNINYGPQAVNQPMQSPTPYTPPIHRPLIGINQPRFPSPIARGYR